VDFKLHAPNGTVVEVNFSSGKLEEFNVIPKERGGDVEINQDSPSSVLSL